MQILLESERSVTCKIVIEASNCKLKKLHAFKFKLVMFKFSLRVLKLNISCEIEIYLSSNLTCNIQI